MLEQKTVVEDIEEENVVSGNRFPSL